MFQLMFFEVDDEQEQIVISRKNLKNKDAKCHIDLLRIDEDDSGHYVYIKDCSRLFKLTKKANFIISLTFANIVIMVFGSQDLLNKTR